MWQAIGSSVRGSGHTTTNLPCQDAHCFRISNDCIVVTVADGLGSAAKSEQGAKIAAETSLETIVEALGDEQLRGSSSWVKLLSQSFEQARRNIEQQAELDGLSLHSFGTTLIVVVATSGWLAVGHIGDGAVVASLEDGELITFSPPQRGEYCNEVKPLTASDALDLIQFSVEPVKVSGVAVFTDGLQSVSMDLVKNTPYAPFFIPLFEVISREVNTAVVSQQLSDFLNSERICERTDDDKTLVVFGNLQ